MFVKKALLTAVVALALFVLGCVPAREHQRQVSALTSQLENEKHARAELESELDELIREYEQTSEQLEEEKDRAQELQALSDRLEEAKLERERNLQEMEALVKDISGMRIEPRAEGDFIVIENEILFDPGQIELREGARFTIEQTVIPYIREQLEKNDQQMIRIDGHTDGQPIRVSPWEDNYHLSVMRAHSVMSFLGEKGVPHQNLFLTGFGPNNPIVEPQDPEEDVEENRRVEILLVPPREDDIRKILEDFVR